MILKNKHVETFILKLKKEPLLPLKKTKAGNNMTETRKLANKHFLSDLSGLITRTRRTYL